MIYPQPVEFFFQVDNFHMNFWPHTNKFYVLLKYYINKNISAKPAAILTLGTWWPCNSILPFGKYFLSTYILMLVKPLPLTEPTEMPMWEKLEYFSNIWTANNLYRNQKIFRTKKIYLHLSDVAQIPCRQKFYSVFANHQMQPFLIANKSKY